MNKLQVENGNYTRIVNQVIEELIKIPFKGKELNVCLFIIRKTWGFNKLEDEISLTQFEKALDLSRPSIVKALKNLQLVNVVKLVKRGGSKKDANIYSFNKYFETWKLVKTAKLVKTKRSTSKAYDKKLVKTALHTKDNNKRQYTKDNLQPEVAGQINPLMDLFYKVNPMLNYGNKTQRSTLEELLNKFGEKKLRNMIEYAISIQGQRFAPVVTTPLQFKNKFGELNVHYNRKNNESAEIPKI